MKVPYVDIAAQYQDHKEEILKSLDRVLASGQYIMGEELESFEQQFANLCQTKYAIGVANGTDAIVLTLKALGISEGDEVITAPNSWVSSMSSIALAGAIPRFVDVKDDYNMDPELLRKAITEKTKGILPVHLTGKAADMDLILDIAKEKGLWVIEDAAQSVNAEYKGRKTGSMGTAGCFSLHPLKNLNAAGDGGIITTNDESLYQKLLLWRNHGIQSRTEVLHWGYNSRLDCLQAAILNCKMPFIEQCTNTRRKNAAQYRERLSKLVKCPVDEPNCRDVYHLFMIQCERRDQLKNFLGQNGIASAIHYPKPLHLLECASKLKYTTGDFPITEKQSDRILSLPVHQNLSIEQIDYVCDKIVEFYQHG